MTSISEIKLKVASAHFFKGEQRNGFVLEKDEELFFYELPESDPYDIGNIISEYS